MKNLISLFKNADVGLFVIQLPNKQIVDANFCFARILGYESLQALFVDFAWKKHFSLAGQNDPFTLPNLKQLAEYREIHIYRVDGSSRWVQFSYGVYPKTGIIEGIIVDISDRKTLEHEIIRISDLEKEKFGRDLHDTLGQTLTGTAFLCRALVQRLTKNDAKLEEQVKHIENLVNQAMVQARYLAHGLAHIEVKPAGIVAHLKMLATQAQAVFGKECVLNTPAKVVLNDAESATHLYRIAQEAVHNALKYSGSSKIAISLTKTANGGILTVEDFGRGLSKKPSRTKGIGMQLMNLRARLMGATVTFFSRKDQGLKITCTFPLAKEKMR
jgi:PAS domain S-box-containing protein